MPRIIAALTLAAVACLILLAADYQAAPEPRKLAAAALIGGALIFGLWELLRPIWRA